MVYSTGEHRQTDSQQLVVIENECRVMSKPGHSVDLRSLHAFGVRTFFATLRYDNGDDYENIT